MIINRLYTEVFTTALVLFLSVNCLGANLMSVYQLAEKNDPTYLQEIAAHRVALESRPQALSQLLPSVDLSADTTRLDQDISLSGGFGSGGDVNYNTRGYTLSISQPLFRRDRFIALAQSDSEINKQRQNL